MLNLAYRHPKDMVKGIPFDNNCLIFDPSVDSSRDTAALCSDYSAGNKNYEVLKLQTGLTPEELLVVFEQKFGIDYFVYVPGVAAPFNASKTQLDLIVNEVRYHPESFI